MEGAVRGTYDRWTAGAGDELDVGYVARGEGGIMEIDPVCGMEVDPATAEHSSEYAGKRYYFCSKGCLEDFQEDPASFVSS